MLNMAKLSWFLVKNDPKEHHAFPGGGGDTLNVEVIGMLVRNAFGKP